MKRRIMAVCRSRKRMRTKVAAVLDRYLWRVGDRTWTGYASSECLDRIVGDLRTGISRNAAVAIYEQSSRTESRRPIMIIGSRSRFSHDGLSPIMTRKVSNGLSRETENVVRAVLSMTAVWHDVGKCMTAFQIKIRDALKGGKGKADPVRHELWSLLFLDHCAGQAEGDFSAFLDMCEKASFDFDAAAAHAAKASSKLYAGKSANPPPFFGVDKTGSPLLRMVADMVIVHHRLVKVEVSGRVDFPAHVFSDYHVPSGKSVTDVFRPWNGDRLWDMDSWRDMLTDAAKMLRDVSSKVIIPDAATVMRTSFMIADHVGSGESDDIGTSLSDNVLLANTKKGGSGKPVPADTLDVHTRRVFDAVSDATRLMCRDRMRLPFLKESEIPENILRPAANNPVFAWQAKAAESVKRMVSSSEGGFFACLIAGTGTGKTRGAPTVLTAAAMSDVNPDRRRLRFVLGLGLRTLASQSGRDYVEDLCFPASDVSVIVGGKPVEKGGNKDYVDPDDPEVVTEDSYGSSNRFSDMRYYDADRGFEGSRSWVDMPPAVQRLVGDSQRDRTLKAMLSSPISVMTLDHVMSVADARKGGHVGAAIRIMGGDVILDEIDQYDDEDLAAISRLCFWVGTSGGRMIVMSATTPKDILVDLHASYSAGWENHAKMTGTPDTVHAMICGDTPESVVTTEGDMNFHKAVDFSLSIIRERLASVNPMRSYETLVIGNDIPESIRKAIDVMHGRHSTRIGSINVSFGLVRITTIKSLLRIFNDITNFQDDDGTATLFICLHSRLLRWHRSLVENTLRKALTRKGDNPDTGIEVFLRDHVSVDANVTDIRIVVMSSPVIETGNDVDFDYAIIDPLSPRSIVQTAGRVNRHRMKSIIDPNVYVMSSHLHRDDDGKLAYPGVETKRASVTGIKSYELPKSATFPDSYVMVGDDYRVDAGWTLFPDMSSDVGNGERHMRDMFRIDDNDNGRCQGTGRFRTDARERLSDQFGLRRKFRRSERPDVELFLENGGNPVFRERKYRTGKKNMEFGMTRIIPCENSKILLHATKSEIRERAGDMDSVVRLDRYKVNRADHLVVHGCLGVMTDVDF